MTSPVAGIMVEPEPEQSPGQRVGAFLKEIVQETSFSNLGKRMLGVITFNRNVYQDIASSSNASGPAMLFWLLPFCLTSLLVGIGSMLLLGMTDLMSILLHLGINLIGFPVLLLLGWSINGIVASFVANRFFQGSATPERVMRVSGFSGLFLVLNIIPLFIGLALASLPMLVAQFFGLREAAHLDTKNTILTMLVMMLMSSLVSCLVGGIIFAIVAVGAGLFA